MPPPPAPSLSLDGKVILITGGLGALGLAIVQRLTRAGARMVIGDLLPAARAERLLRGGGVRPGTYGYVSGDVSKPGPARKLVDAAFRKFKRLDIALCHTGIVVCADLVDFSEKDFDRQINANVKTAFLVAQAAAQRMIKARIKGKLIFTSSWVAHAPWPGIGPYNASKAAMNQLMRSFARELAPHGIRANVVAPGIVGAGMAKRQWDMDPVYRARAKRAIPLGVMQPLDSVADTFHFACSDMSDYMTGTILLADGGCSLYPMD